MSPRVEQVLARLATQGLLLATGPLLARATGPQGRGEAAIGVALAVLLPPVVGLGFGSAVRSVCSPAQPHRIALRAAGLRRSVFGGAVAALLAQAVIGSGMLDIGIDSRAAIVLAASTAGLSAFVDGLVSLRLIEGRQRQAALTRVIPVAFFAIYCLTLFATQQLSAATYLVGYAMLPVARFLVVAASRHPRIVDPEPAPRWPHAGVWGVPHELSDAGLAQIATLAAGLTLGAAELGLFAVALTVARVPNFVASGVSDSDVQQMAAAREAGRRYDAIGAAVRLMKAVAAVSLAGALAGWVATPVIFGREFGPSRPAMVVLLLAAPTAAAVGYLSAYLVASGNPLRSAQLQLALFVSVAVGSGLAAALAESTASRTGAGALGAAIGYAMTAAMVSLWALLRPTRRVRSLGEPALG